MREPNHANPDDLNSSPTRRRGAIADAPRNAALIALTLITLVSIGVGLRSKSSMRWHGARSQHELDCSRWRAKGGAAVCQTDAPTQMGSESDLLSSVKVAHRHIARARTISASSEIHREEREVAELSAALDVAMRFDRMGTVVSELSAASLVNDVLDVAEGRRENLRPLSASSQRRLLAGRELRSARHPLEGERLFATGLIAAAHDQAKATPFVLGADAIATELSANMGSHLAQLESAILKKDASTCARVGGSARPQLLAPPPASCEKLIDLVNTAERLARAQT